MDSSNEVYYGGDEDIGQYVLRQMSLRDALPIQQACKKWVEDPVQLAGHIDCNLNYEKEDAYMLAVKGATRNLGRSPAATIRACNCFGRSNLPENRFENLGHKLERLRAVVPSITVLPSSLSRLTSLTSLELISDNPAGPLPYLSNLESFTLKHIGCREPKDLNTYDFSMFPNLQSLLIDSFCHTQLPSFPVSLSSTLQHLEIRMHRLKQFPASISQLTTLKHLSVSCPLVEHLPSGVGNLPSLTSLELKSAFKGFPQALTSLKKLHIWGLSRDLQQWPQVSCRADGCDLQ